LPRPAKSIDGASGILSVLRGHTLEQRVVMFVLSLLPSERAGRTIFTHSVASVATAVSDVSDAVDCFADACAYVDHWRRLLLLEAVAAIENGYTRSHCVVQRLSRTSHKLSADGTATVAVCSHNSVLALGVWDVVLLTFSSGFRCIAVASGAANLKVNSELLQQQHGLQLCLGVFTARLLFNLTSLLREFAGLERAIELVPSVIGRAPVATRSALAGSYCGLRRAAWCMGVA
jgi:hypothetical protein